MDEQAKQEIIRDEMETTRTALSEKLEALEDKVTTSVQEATQEVADTVATVTDSVQETVETVKETVGDTLETVRNSIRSVFDLGGHVERHPWFVMGSSVAAGFIIGEYMQKRTARASAMPLPQATRLPAANYVPNGHAKAPPSEDGQAKSSRFFDLIAPELNKLKGLALGALMGTVREVLTEAASSNLKQPLIEIIDSVTEKLGGTRVAPKPKQENPAHTRDSDPSQIPTAEPDYSLT